MARDYSLDMSDAFDRAIAIMLLYLMAAHPTYEFKSFSYEAIGAGKHALPPSWSPLDAF